MKILDYIVFFLFIIATAGCATSNSGKSSNLFTQADSPQQDPVPEYVFQVGDVFDVKFFENPELDQTVIVRPDGRISMPLVEELSVVGLTPSQLDMIITESYAKKIREPEATIVLREFSGQKIYVGGEVLNPGLLQLKGKMTLLQSIFAARGFMRTAKRNSVIVMRNGNNSVNLHRIDANKILKEGGRDFLLRPYDIVFVPKTFIAHANDFVDLYINNIIPRFAHLGFSYGLNKTKYRGGDYTLIINE